MDNMKSPNNRLEDLLLEGIPSGRRPSGLDYVKALGIIAVPYSGDRAFMGLVHSVAKDATRKKKALFYASAVNILVAKYAMYAATAYAFVHR